MLDVLLPIFFVALVELLKRAFELSLEVVEELGLSGTRIHHEPHRVGVGQGSASFDDEIGNFDQEVKFLWVVPLRDLDEFLDLFLNGVPLLLSEGDGPVMLIETRPVVVELSKHAFHAPDLVHVFFLASLEQN